MWSFKKKKVITSIPHSKLELCFTDLNGKKYYKFPEDMTLPVERFGKLQEFMMFMTSSISSVELDKFIDAGEKAVMDFLNTKTKSLSKVGWVFEMMRQRKTMCIHTELLYNFLAVQVIREDEQAEYFNNGIHLEKIAQFKEETKAGKTHDFFFAIGLKKLNAMFNMSEVEWTQFWAESITEQQITDLMLNSMLEEKSFNAEKVLTNK